MSIDDSVAQMNFESFSFCTELQMAIQDLGFTTPTSIQKKCIPLMLSGKDLVGQAQTGSGKTAAFCLPLLQKLASSQSTLEVRNLQALILCPTRELCLQVVSDLKKMGRHLKGLQVLALIGGVSGREQKLTLEQGVHIVVATPGRLVDHLSRHTILLDQITCLVLDEADKMLDLGFAKEIGHILQALPSERQTVLFSATFPEEIKKLSSKIQNRPVRIEIEEAKSHRPAIDQYVYSEPKEEKINILFRILQQHPSRSSIIFCNQKITVNEIGQLFEEKGVSCSILSGDLDQRERDKVISLYRNGSLRILIATDVAARGLDIDHVELVVNFDLPHQPEVYVHRIGRTGRAGRSGTAVSIETVTDDLKVLAIEKLTGQVMKREKLGFKNQHGLGESYQTAAMKTLQISGGKKDKLRAGDILGALTGQPNPIEGALIGKIEIYDHSCIVAVASKIADKALQKLKLGRIKGKKYPVKFCN